MQYLVNGTRLNVLEQGTGDRTVVLLHYFGGSSNSWLEVMAQLQGLYCIAPDLPGFGDSESIAGSTVEDAAAYVLALVQQLQLKHYTLVGHSMGGKIALVMAATQPTGLESLILLATSPPTPEPMPEEERSRLLRTYGDRAAAEATAHKITASPLPDPLFDRVVQDNLRSSHRAWQAWLNCGSRQDISAIMPKISVPVLVVGGAEDPVITKDVLEQEVVAQLANARMLLLPEAGHLLPIEAPRSVSQAIVIPNFYPAKE